MYIKYSKITDSAKAPTRANPSDAGLDVYSDSKTVLYILPNRNAIIPTGLKFEIPHGYELCVENRGSMAGKFGLLVGACIIDSGYNGEVFIDLHNVGESGKQIHLGEKIAQLVMRPVIHAIPLEVAETELYRNDLTISSRGSGKLGSTNAD
jgi:dUTP pyrophosphatase